jgi:phosphatidylserine/phosphatidylglycerophosphate/cardiolipin synthase-like enzyme
MSQPEPIFFRRWLAVGLLFISCSAFAFLWAGKNEHAIVPATGTMEVAFTPGDDAAGLIIGAIGQAQRQILVQAFSFTHEGIARALIAAHKRGVEVKVIADREQTERMERSKVVMTAGAGVPVWLDGEHQSAHNKVMVIDAGSPSAVLVTGSYNFTNAAQYKNAENLLLMRGNEKLIKLYRDNWNVHLAHAKPYREP